MMVKEKKEEKKEMLKETPSKPRKVMEELLHQTLKIKKVKVKVTRIRKEIPRKVRTRMVKETKINQECQVQI